MFTFSKILKLILKIFICFISFFVLFIIAARLYFRLPVRDYYKVSMKAFVIPGIQNGFIPQGLSYDDADQNFYITGYMKNGSASPVYVVNKNSGKLINSVRLQNQDGSIFNGHAGGISVYENNVFVAGSDNACLYVFSKEEITNAHKNDFVKCCDVINLFSADDKIEVAFTTVHNNKIYAGEFYRLPNYPTLPSHTVKTSDGENHAIMLALSDINGTFTPTAAYSLPDKVQGLCFANGKIYVSTSWAVSPSKIFIYDESKLVQNSTINSAGYELPLYILDSQSLVETKVIAPMSEEIEFVDNQFYIMCESASNKYIFGKFTGARWCYKSTF